MKLPKASSYPKSIYFGTEDYKIIFKKNFECFGETDPEAHTVTIKKGMSRRATLATFVHELLHVIEIEDSMKLSHATIYALEKAIVELLLDNFL